jgi:hypothetical protein
MPLLLTPLRLNDSGQNVGQLHGALLKVGAPVAAAEKTAKRFGATTLAAVTTFRKQFGLPDANGNAPFDASVGRLLPIAAAANEGNGVALRAAVREALAAAGNNAPAQENNLLARFALIAGDYPAAQQAVRKAPQVRDLVAPIIDAVLDLRSQSPKPPEVPFPENFYTYRNDLLPLAVIDNLQEQLRTVTPAQANGPDLGPDAGRGPVIIQVARFWLEAIRQWQLGNSKLELRSYDGAVTAYNSCQRAVLNYFTRYHAIDVGTGTFGQRLTNLITHLVLKKDQFPHLWEKLQLRRTLLSLAELNEHDWAPSPVFPATALELIKKFLLRDEFPLASVLTNREQVLEAPLVILAYVLVPLARAEANRLRRQHERAVADLNRVIKPIQIGSTAADSQSLLLTCDFIELPFAQLLLAETLLDKADAEYKARTRVADQDVAALEAARAEFNQRLPEQADRNRGAPFQLLQAARTYLSVFELFADEGEYVPRVKRGLDALTTGLSERLSQGDVTSSRFRAVGMDITIPTIRPATGTLPGVGQRVGPHEPLLKFQPPPGQSVMREINPRVYAVLLDAQARLVQLWSGFNYLGYTDDYVPPWRFNFLLDRARYFAEHAKNAQRDYLNFLGNAEREEFQELSAAQNVEMEKSNVRIESEQVKVATLEVAAAQQSLVLARLSATNSQLRLDRYVEFDENMDDLEEGSLFGSIVSGLSRLATVAAAGVASRGAAAAGAAAVFIKDSFSSNPANSKADEQRELEKFNLRLAVGEATEAAKGAAIGLGIAKGQTTVAALRRQAALLRHEFAVQNLTFLRNRVLDAEQWYRLAGSIRSVSETYLRYAIEIAFLAEQAYEFEADKSMNVIRFDYDQSVVGDFLAADFLLRDLDTLEQDLIVNQRLGQQEVRYVLSMARDFPEALQELRAGGVTTFGLPLEQLERRFPGLHNIRIGAVDILPLALMDPTRFSLELTYMGSSQVRLKGQPGAPDPWPKQFRTRGPETTIFSGLSRQEASAVFPFASTGQRNAFEGLGASSAWQIDMSMQDNQVVPGTLADLLITFTLSGYYDSDLRAQQAGELKPRTSVVTRLLFARQDFADAFYEFNQSGRMEWQVTDDLLTLAEPVGRLRNLAVLLTPAPTRINFGRLRCSFPFVFRVTESGEIRSDIPQVTFDLSAPLTLTARAVVPAGAKVSWDFGDGSGLQSGPTIEHAYARPGSYGATLRVVHAGRLSEYKADVIVSRTSQLLPPLAVFPSLRRDTGATDVPPGHVRVVASIAQPAGETLAARWSLRNGPALKGESVSFDLKPGEHTLLLSATRALRARVHGRQRFLPENVLVMSGLSFASNRRFDEGGKETTGIAPQPAANPLTSHLFAPETEISPADVWVLEFSTADNPSLLSVSSSDTEQFAIGEVQDAILALEFETQLV